MQELGILPPSQVTVSILLKNIHARSPEREIAQTMDMSAAMEEPLGEVLISSVVEACIRFNKNDLLVSKLKQLHGNPSMTISGAHTFGSLIKACAEPRTSMACGAAGRRCGAGTSGPPASRSDAWSRRSSATGTPRAPMSSPTSSATTRNALRRPTPSSTDPCSKASRAQSVSNGSSWSSRR